MFWPCFPISLILFKNKTLILSPNEPLFILGDVHGCWHTFRALLRHWRPDSERLLLLGDLINKGPHSLAVLDEFRTLAKDYGALALRGNHEHEWLKYLNNPKYDTFIHLFKPLFEAYRTSGRDPWQDMAWIGSWPSYWQTDYIFASHAGWSVSGRGLGDLDHAESLIWTRGPLRSLPRLQIIGHRPQLLAHYRAEEHCYYLDTGAFLGRGLSGLRLGAEGEVLACFTQPTDALDRIS